MHSALSLRSLLTGGLMAFAVVATLSGMRILTRFDQTPGAVGDVAPRWPVLTTIHGSPDRPHLLVFLHPFCPCSVATLAELAKIMVRLSRQGPAMPGMTILFVRPAG